jgi:NAD(P)-dependent dehydrogenase (short-subunit alcohol dehydrogenase family)
VQAKQPFVLSPRTWTSGLKGKIRVNVIAPGTTDTAIFDGAPQEMKDSFVTIIPIGSTDQPREIASDALFLASDDFSFVTGIELYVDSGTASLVESTNLTSGILFHLHSIFILQQ